MQLIEPYIKVDLKTKIEYLEPIITNAISQRGGNIV
jgi:hypothetical protein